MGINTSSLASLAINCGGYLKSSHINCSNACSDAFLKLMVGNNV